MGFVRWCLPWELVRLQRVEDAVYARVLDETQLVERELHNRGFVIAGLVSAGHWGVPWTWLNTTFPPPDEAVDGALWRNNGESDRESCGPGPPAFSRVGRWPVIAASINSCQSGSARSCPHILPGCLSILGMAAISCMSRRVSPCGSTATLAIMCCRHSRLSPAQGPEAAGIEVQQTTDGRVHVSILRKGQQVPANAAPTAPVKLSAHIVPVPDSTGSTMRSRREATVGEWPGRKPETSPKATGSGAAGTSAAEEAYGQTSRQSRTE